MSPLMIDIVPNFEGVLDALISLKSFMTERGLNAEKMGEIELACAEALNNIVEHARHPDDALVIALRADFTPERLTIDLTDNGLKFDAPEAAEAKRNMLSSGDARAEGGFGWGLIHSLADKVTLSRRNNTNHLRVQFLLSPCAFERTI